MSDGAVHRFASFDGTESAWREQGTGRPVVLLHGLFSNAVMNWQRYGTAATVAAAGFRVILPDFRAHGDSAAPQDGAAYPPDVLALDVEALITHLGLTDFDLGGYSLGARTTVRLLARGMRPRRAVLGGMGLAGITGGAQRAAWFLNVIANAASFRPGSPEFFAAAFMKQNGIDGEAVAHVLRAQVTTSAAALGGIATPVLVACGRDDRDNGSAPDLAAALEDATYAEIPGNHMSAVTMPELGAAMAGWLAADTV